jgi:hypothetical protein
MRLQKSSPSFTVVIYLLLTTFPSSLSLKVVLREKEDTNNCKEEMASKGRFHFALLSHCTGKKIDFSPI